MGLGGQQGGQETRDCDSKQQFKGSLEVWPLWAQMERLYVKQDTPGDWMPPVRP